MDLVALCLLVVLVVLVALVVFGMRANVVRLRWLGLGLELEAERSQRGVPGAGGVGLLKAGELARLGAACTGGAALGAWTCTGGAVGSPCIPPRRASPRARARRAV